MTRAASLLIAALLESLAVAACAAMPSQAAPGAQPDEPAILVSPTAATRASLAQAVSEALHGAPVRLAGDALTRDSRLIITRAEHRDAAGLPIQGRSLEKPERFGLVERAGRCVLIQERTGRRWPLRSATCRPLAPRPAAAPAAPADN